MCIIYDSPRFREHTHTRAHTDAHTDAHMVLSGGLWGNRAERKLRAFAKQGLSGVMATGLQITPPSIIQGKERRHTHAHIYRCVETQHSQKGFKMI